MPRVPESRRIGRMAVNELRALLERHGHIVQEIDGGNDHGEDLHVTFVQNGQRTEDSVAVQVKGGVSTRTRRGHRVPVGDHGDNWRDGTLPVLCVVHDAERGGLFWANATRQLRRARALRKTAKSIVVSRESVLNDASLSTFVQGMRHYLAREREGVGRWADMADVEFAPDDIVKPFENEVYEPMVFWQRRGQPYAVLLHHDLDWEPVPIQEEMLRFWPIPSVGQVILDIAEAHWLMGCFKSTEWWRRPIEQPDSA
ncbi:protein of unknown function [Streptomyces sp. 2224.1]|nr:uncharacterized protein DUF4365 [Streptomyces sp. 2321.6]SDR48092.1 protein of unknown function [Streptomyces sp. KS_16]SEC37801.1 protein of unknown function [Streptomyces sp. 2224.1]SEC67149.1 protein of unknown function [Streptomyces sp. 2133.1]SEE94086.1 protein of unknown function [Streptomyces sp. 2112.3]SNC68746.1 protein of unknown function [Streptomyces sp. 2114.4]